MVTKKTVSPEKASDVVLTIKSLPESDTDLIILGSAEGYLSSGTSVVVSPKAGERSATLKLVKDEPGEVADAIFSAQEEIGDHVDKDGVVTSAITLESRASAADPGLNVTIPQGVTMTDADGQPVKGSVLKVVSFDPRKPAALAAYPGGMNVLAAVNGFTGFDGTPASGKRQVNFKTAGFAVIQIEGEDGRKVRHFSSDIEIAMQFPEGTTDAKGHVIGAGDPVPIWSFSETSGQWRFEKNGTAADLTPNDGPIDVVYNTDHLTAWNLDWHYGDVCTANVNVIDTLGVSQLALVNHFVVSIPTAPIYRNLYNSNPADGNLLLFNVPVGHQATVTAYDINGTMLGSVTVDDLCDGNVGTGGWNTNVDNEVDLVIDSDTTPVNVSFTASCPTAGVNAPGFNSNTVPLPLVLSNGTSISLPNGTGQVGGGTWNLSPLPSNPTLFNAIDWANGGNPPIPQISVSGTSFNQDLQLSNAFCSPTSGQIDGAGCNGATTGLTFFVPGSAHGNPRDVVKDKEGNLYVSTDENGILKRDVNGNGGFTVFVSGGTSNYPSANPSASNDEVSEVTAGWPYGMDLIATGGHEYLYYVDRTGHCVNVITLDTNQVSTVVGQCGQPGNVFSSSTDNVNATDGKIDTPYDIVVFPTSASGLTKFISAKGRILMVNTDTTCGT